MDERHTQLAGLETCLIRDSARPRVTIVFLHGYGMRPADLTPFAHSLGVPGASYVFPQAPLCVSSGRYAWWPMCQGGWTASPRQARDLAGEHPSGRQGARELVRNLIEQLIADGEGEPILLAGFSQGGMLACDTVLFERVRVDGLAMMSSSCIAIDEWNQKGGRLKGLSAFVSHGRRDDDLAFAAGERVGNFLHDSGACVRWVPFDGGHEIPFSVWRQFRSFARETRPVADPLNEKSFAYECH
jgi:phospholipase/carboxylesterase